MYIVSRDKIGMSPQPGLFVIVIFRLSTYFDSIENLPVLLNIGQIDGSSQ